MGSYFFRDENAIPRGGHRDHVGTRPKYNMPSCLMLYINYEDASSLQDARDVTKSTCCLPRLKGERPQRLQNLVKDGCAADY